MRRPPGRDERRAIEQIGTPADVYESPATVFVADFLGVSNLMDAEAISDSTHASAHCTVAGSGTSACVPGPATSRPRAR